MYTTIKQVRQAFWLSRNWEGFQGWDCRSYPNDIDGSFCLFVGLSRLVGDISDQLTDITL
jgi:hypothetical protein